MTVPDDIDRMIIRATEDGLPLVAQPYHALAEDLGLSVAEVMARLRAMAARGIIRRMGIIPNHYALGVTANGMSVWDVADEHAGALGRKIGALDFVSHCYRRPRHPPDWPYNLFAMVHGRSRDEVRARVGEIAALLGDECRGHDILFSKRILKKTGLRLGPERKESCSA